MISINGNEYPTRVEEMTLGQWAEVSKIIQVFSKEPLLQFEGILRAIGVPDKEIDTVEIARFKDLQDSMVSNAENFELVEEIDRYKLDLSKPLNLKTSKKIDRIANLGNETVALLAFFYRDENLTDAEHFADAHIKHKMKQFESMQAVNFVVAIGAITEYLVNETKLLNGDTN